MPLFLGKSNPISSNTSVTEPFYLIRPHEDGAQRLAPGVLLGDSLDTVLLFIKGKLFDRGYRLTCRADDSTGIRAANFTPPDRTNMYTFLDRNASDRLLFFDDNLDVTVRQNLDLFPTGIDLEINEALCEALLINRRHLTKVFPELMPGRNRMVAPYKPDHWKRVPTIECDFAELVDRMRGLIGDDPLVRAWLFSD